MWGLVYLMIFLTSQILSTSLPSLSQCHASRTEHCQADLTRHKVPNSTRALYPSHHADLKDPSYFGLFFFSSEKVMSGIPIIKMSMRSHDIQMTLNSLVFASICKSVLLVLSESPEQHCDFSGLDRVLSDFTGDSPSKLRLRDARKRPTKA